MIDYGENWKNISAFIKKRDDYTCTTCGKKFPACSPYLHVHHIIPLSKGGTNEASNLTTLCYQCHVDNHPHMQKHKASHYKKFKPLKRR